MSQELLKFIAYDKRCTMIRFTDYGDKVINIEYNSAETKYHIIHIIMDF